MCNGKENMKKYIVLAFVITFLSGCTDTPVTIKNKLIDKDFADKCAMRIVDPEGYCSGYSYKLDFGSSNDLNNFEIIDQDGVKVLIDPKATMFLLGSTMDYISDKISSRFVFDNPNEKSTCGCGESFSI